MGNQDLRRGHESKLPKDVNEKLETLEVGKKPNVGQMLDFRKVGLLSKKTLRYLECNCETKVTKTELPAMAKKKKRLPIAKLEYKLEPVSCLFTLLMALSCARVHEDA